MKTRTRIMGTVAIFWVFVCVVTIAYGMITDNDLLVFGAYETVMGSILVILLVMALFWLW